MGQRTQWFYPSLQHIAFAFLFLFLLWFVGGWWLMVGLKYSGDCPPLQNRMSSSQIFIFSGCTCLRSFRTVLTRTDHSYLPLSRWIRSDIGRSKRTCTWSSTFWGLDQKSLGACLLNKYVYIITFLSINCSRGPDAPLYGLKEYCLNNWKVQRGSVDSSLFKNNSTAKTKMQSLNDKKF